MHQFRFFNFTNKKTNHLKGTPAYIGLKDLRNTQPASQSSLDIAVALYAGGVVLLMDIIGRGYFMPLSSSCQRFTNSSHGRYVLFPSVDGSMK